VVEDADARCLAGPEKPNYLYFSPGLRTKFVENRCDCLAFLLCTGQRCVLRRVRDVTLEAYEHQDVPFVRLLQELPPGRQTHNELAPVGFMLQNAPVPDVDLPGLRIHPFEIENGTAKRDLVPIVTETGETLTISAVFRVDLFARETVGRLLAQYERILEDLVSDPGRPLSGFCLR